MNEADRLARIDVTRGEHEEVLEAIQQWTRRSVILLRIMVALIVAMAVGGVYLIGANNDRIDDIEQSRRDSVVFSCEETNQRHSASLAALDQLSAAAIERQPGRAAQIRQSTEQFKLFVNALVPERECQSYADELLNLPQ